MTDEEQYAEIGRAHVDLEELHRKKACIRNRLSRISRAVTSAVEAIDGLHPLQGTVEQLDGLPELPTTLGRTLERIDELETFLKSITASPRVDR